MPAGNDESLQEAKRKAVESLDNVPITSQLAKWEAAAKPSTELKKQRNKGDTLVGTGRFELPTPPTPSDPNGSNSQ